jgi:hypothetical protein
VELDFIIEDGKTTVTSTLKVKKNPKVDHTSASSEEDEASTSLVLDGDSTSVTLVDIEMDGVKLHPDQDYTLTENSLTLLQVHDGAVIKTTVTIVPEDNTQLSGLYKSGPMYCTQCEAMGFRRITYYPDRPDNVRTLGRLHTWCAVVIGCSTMLLLCVVVVISFPPSSNSHTHTPPHTSHTSALCIYLPLPYCIVPGWVIDGSL